MHFLHHIEAYFSTSERKAGVKVLGSNPEGFE